MKTLLKLSLWLCFCCLLSFSYLRAATGGPIQVGYLLDEMFVIMDGDWDTVGTQGKISDWDIDSKAGTLDTAYWNYLAVTDSSTTGAIEMRKPFLPQSSGTISVEFRFLLPAKVDGMVWALRADRDNSLVEFTTSGGNIGYVNSSGTFVSLVSNYVAGQAYTVHADVTLPNVSGAIYVDGVLLASGNVFRSTSLTQASQFYIGTPVAATGVLRLYNVTITKGYKVYERFTNATVGAVPANWTASSAAGAASVQLANDSNPKDMMSFQLNDSSTSAASTLARTFTASNAKLVWEYKFMLPAKVDGVQAQLRGGTTSAVTFITANGGLAYLSSSGTAVSLWPNYKANLWYIVRVVADPVTKTADIYINGKLEASQVAFAATTSSLDNLLFSTSVAGTGAVWVDDIYVYDFQPLPSDYVPAVQTVTSRGYKVGVQSFFSGWRPGNHCGWDWIYRYPNHDPYIGFYDNGNPEAMDWQLKWMAESGVNFFMDCWYKNTGGYPMKEPQFEYTQGPIHSAYFYAQYSNKVKFAIADYSLGTTTAADFTNYILPYWMEYYFKDPRYYVIPGANKGYPVISLGSATTWINVANNAMQNSITALRAALVAEGFDGAVVLAKYEGSDRPTMDSLHAAGIDYCYAYWGGSDIPTLQNNLKAQRDSGSALKPIADVGQGWSGEAWDIFSLPGTYTTLADFGTMSSWVRDTFMTSGTLSGYLSSSMMFYDNWNEFGEGHYLCPTNLQGFGYLDQIRSAFTTSTLTDVAPTAVQKARINVLYTRGWNGRVWAFDSFYPDTEGWAVNNQVSGLAQNKGYLEGTITGSDPSIISRDGYAIDASLYKVIKVRMKNATAGTTAKFHFITNTDGTYDEAKAQSFNLTANDPNYTEYTIDMSGVPGWTGTIRQLCFAPVTIGAANGMTFSIDYIKVASGDQSWDFNSDTEGWAANYQVSGLVENNGCLNGSITGSDPSIISRDGYAIDASLYNVIKVRMKNATAGTAAKVYFITNTDGTFNEAKAKSFTLTVNDPNYTEYTLNMSGVPGWTGTIRRLRLDPVDTGAVNGMTFSVDYIKIVSSFSATAVTGTTATLNGTLNPNGVSTSAYFQYGTTTSYGSVTSTQGLGSGTNFVAVTGSLTGLTAYTTYHYQLVSVNANGTFYGTDQTFTTAPNGIPSITSAANATGTNGALFSDYQITVDNDATAFGASGLPAGLSFTADTGIISGTPTVTGTFAVALSATNVLGSGAKTLTLTILPPPYTAWKSQMFTPAQLLNATISGDNAMPAGDGISNLMKYALNLQPFGKGTAGLPTTGITGGSYLTLSYTHVKAATDIAYIVEVSADLQTWNSGEAYTAPVSVSDQGATETVVIQDLQPMNSTNKQFIRLKVTKP